MNNLSVITIGFFELQVGPLPYLALLGLTVFTFALTFKTQLEINRDGINHQDIKKTIAKKFAKSFVYFALIFGAIIIIWFFFWYDGSLEKFRNRETFSMFQILFFWLTSSGVFAVSWNNYLA